MDDDPRANPEGAQDVPDTTLFWRWAGQAGRPVVGWALIGVGALAIVIGYFGLSDRVLVTEQLPYLLSGGIGGIALVIVGGVLLATTDTHRDAERLDRVERAVADLQTMVADLHGALLRPRGADGNGQSGPASDAGGGRTATRSRVYAVADGTTFHRQGCAVLVDKHDVSSLAPASARRKGLTPCALCEPLSGG